MSRLDSQLLNRVFRCAVGLTDDGRPDWCTAAHRQGYVDAAEFREWVKDSSHLQFSAREIHHNLPDVLQEKYNAGQIKSYLYNDAMRWVPLHVATATFSVVNVMTRRARAATPTITAPVSRTEPISLAWPSLQPGHWCRTFTPEITEDPHLCAGYIEPEQPKSAVYVHRWRPPAEAAFE